MLHISIIAEKIGNLWGLPITNSLLASWLTMAVLFIFAFAVSRKLTLVPSKLQSIAELLVGGLHDMFGQITGHHIKRFFPLLASLFLFILMANWIGLLPGVGTVGFRHEPVVMHEAATEESHSEEAVAPDTHEEVVVDTHGTEVPASAPTAAATATTTEAVAGNEEHHEPAFTPLLRAATADLNLTIALALIAVFSIQYFGFATLGLHYAGRFISFESPIMFFLGILELISEFSKILSFAFRLFGNIFAGEVLLAVMAFLMPFIVPLPFLTMELFVGLIQALVFSMLVAVFLNVAVSHGEGEHV
jgi:F-type H+-transporting ATPase subunit a